MSKPALIHEAEKITFDKWPTARKIKLWIQNIRRSVATASCDPPKIYKWFMKAETAKWENI